MKVLAIVGARPQFIKHAPLSKVLRDAGHIEYLLHTGQHYDYEMSQIFFEEMQIPKPDINLSVGSGSHGFQTGKMLQEIEEVLLKENPDIVLVYGDTNSTLAGALAAVKLNIRLAHIEAGLRSFNRRMPEEHNRVLTDHCADLLFCPTPKAVELLVNEGISTGVHLVGDIMYDAVLQFAEIARQNSTILDSMGLKKGQYLLLTIHRQENTDDFKNLQSILEAITEIDERIIFPVHPRTRQKINQLNFKLPLNVEMIDPIGYLDMLQLEQSARMILTDSGGIQKEAYFFAIPCLTLRHETEWVETVDYGWNSVVGADKNRILEAVRAHKLIQLEHPSIYGDGYAARKIVEQLGN